MGSPSGAEADSMKLLVWGAGAIGGTIGAHLARAGHDVTFVDRAEDHVAAINRMGLRIEGPLAQFVAKAQAFLPDDIAGEFEHVVLAVKAQDTADATGALAPHLRRDGYVVSAQNGLDALADPMYRDVYVEVAREVMRVARARDVTPEGFNGFDPHAFAPDAAREVAERSLDEMVAFNRRSAKTHSGVWRDIAVRKRRTETDAQLGPIVTLGGEAGVATPLVSRLIELMHEVEDGQRPQSHATLDLLRAAVLTG